MIKAQANLNRDLHCERRFARAQVGIPAKLSLIDGDYRCRLVDISLDGAQVISERTPRAGTVVMLKIEGQELFGTVVWSARDTIGIHFDERVPKQLVLHLNSLASGRRGFADYLGRLAAHNWVSGI